MVECFPSNQSNRRSFDFLRFASVAQDDCILGINLGCGTLTLAVFGGADSPDFFHALG